MSDESERASIRALTLIETHISTCDERERRLEADMKELKETIRDGSNKMSSSVARLHERIEQTGKEAQDKIEAAGSAAVQWVMGIAGFIIIALLGVIVWFIDHGGLMVLSK